MIARLPILCALGLGLTGLITAASGLSARDESLSLRSNFRVGSEGVTCTAQYSPSDSRLESMFDRAYSLLCRDAADKVGTLLVLRSDGSQNVSRVRDAFLQEHRCNTVAQDVPIAPALVAQMTTCLDTSFSVERQFYTYQQGSNLYIAEGLAGYQPVLQLGLASLVKDRMLEGRIEVASTNVTDGAAFARVQAGNLDGNSAIREAYRRNNLGNYAESAEFFRSLAAQQDSGSRSLAEFLANQGLQQSNLGNYYRAEVLFNRAQREVALSDFVIQRMIRNFRAMDLLNQGEAELALDELSRDVAPILVLDDPAQIQSGNISQLTAGLINRENLELQQLGAVAATLSPSQRAEILDIQGLLLQGSAHRLIGEHRKALELIEQGQQQLFDDRFDRVVSIDWLKKEIQTERALLFEALGDNAAARRAFEAAIDDYQQSSPRTPATLAAQARYASFLLRIGDDGALGLFNEVVDTSVHVPGSSASLQPLLVPFLEQLSQEGAEDPDAQSAFFKATQLFARPGVAQTQAVLARQLSQGDGDAAAQFRLSVSRDREISQLSSEISRLESLSQPTAPQLRRLDAAKRDQEALRQQQTAIQAGLAQYPQYRAITDGQLGLGELQSLLESGEGYFKITSAGEALFAQFITSDGAKSVRLNMSASELEDEVAILRDSIVVVENGRTTTYPFDVRRAYELHGTLFSGFADELDAIDHLIFEPDGPMLQLPPALLVSDEAQVVAYETGTAAESRDPFDFTGIQWLGRSKDISVAVSVDSFRQIRNITPSQAPRPYLGMGDNSVPLRAVYDASSGNDECAWPLSNWQRPISDNELKIANTAFGGGSDAILRQDDFTDNGLLDRDDLSDYRIVHIASHGLVTAPKPNCPAFPALVTSFGDGGSDGLLSFREIFELELDADLVILSACDTAGSASVAATRAAGISTGGNYALDGLVRAFVGAGARSVLASHWPVPDDFDATSDLMTGLFQSGRTSSVSHSLRNAQRALMDKAETSHPFYWGAFVLVGDGSKPLATTDQTRMAENLR